MTQQTPAKILIVDDEPLWLEAMSLTLARNGLANTRTCDDPREVMDILAKERVGLVLLDLTMPQIGGEELLSRISQAHPDIPVIVITGLNQVESSVRCMKLGAYDYFVKSVEEGLLVACVRRALDLVELRGQNVRLKESIFGSRLRAPEAFAHIHTQSPRMRAIFSYIDAVAESSQPVCITGESGVGKELMAKAVHQSSRPHGQFVAVNVAGVDDTVFADTLFGHERGAYTGADHARGGLIRQAAKGTLFLDEIGDLTQASQMKLLRLLQEGEFFPLGSDRPQMSSARIVVSTHQDLRALSTSGKFRKDLFYRLRIHHVDIPPLRERREDIALLTNHFLQDVAKELGKTPPVVPEELYNLLAAYHFPGNVRELRAMVHDAVSRHRQGRLALAAFREVMGSEPPDPAAVAPGDEVRFPERLPTLDEIQNLLVLEAMRRSGHNQTTAAGLLGITQPSLSRRLKSIREAAGAKSVASLHTG
jgi:DNA-binding NtrC family response regulator